MSWDPLDDAQTPRCPECGAVLRDAGSGYACHSCRIVVIGTISSLVSEAKYGGDGGAE